jgi:iron-sulfur cluster repair protein YtfE (RIC family)
MAILTQPLREEHQELLPQIEQLRAVADMVGDVPIAELRPHIDTAYRFLTEHLIPHAYAEDQALYPVVARLMGAPQATATMSRDHVAVGQLTQELADLRAAISGATASDAQLRALRRVLYGLYTLVSVHFAKEEEIYLPILDQHLTPGDAERMFAAMETAAHAARQQGL